MSLKWKLMLAPLMALLTMTLLIVGFYRLGIKQTEILTYFQVEQQKTSYQFNSIAHQLAINQTNIFSLLEDAVNIEDEGEFYDKGKSYLLKIHDIEEQFKNPDLAKLIPNSIKTQLINYRITTANVILTASVDLKLAIGIMNESTLKFNELNNQLLTLSDNARKSIQQHINEKQSELRNQAIISLIIALFIIISSVSFSILYSVKISIKLRDLISYLSNMLNNNELSHPVNIKEINEITILKNIAINVQETMKQLEFQIINRVKAEEKVRKLNLDLENRVSSRTQELQDSNNELKNTLIELQNTQSKLIESDKLASLGSLVASIAHELNTPIGTALTGITLIQDKINDLTQLIENNQLTKQNLTSSLEVINEGFSISLLSIKRASEQIGSFKSVAIDTTRDDSRTINLKLYIEDIILSLKPRLKKAGHIVVFDCPERLTFHTQPGALAQIFTNLIMNSLIHGFDEKRNGTINIKIQPTPKDIQIIYSDNGKGISSEVSDSIFEAFFTTNRHQGGTGLGTHIIYNLVTQQLKGDIEIEENSEPGLCFIITIPNTKEA